MVHPAQPMRYTHTEKHRKADTQPRNARKQRFYRFWQCPTCGRLKKTQMNANGSWPHPVCEG
jgi:rubrerythrin